MTKQLQQIGSLYATFLAAGDYDNARAALDEFRAAKGERYGSGNNRIYSNGWAGAGITGAIRGELGR